VDTLSKQMTVYYMSGTGNSRRAALWMADRSQTKGVPADAVNIEQVTAAKQELGPIVGLVMPTHGFTAPWLMMRFAASLPRGRGRRAFCVATRGGAKYGRVFTPGIGGSAVFIIALILLLKGYRPAGVMGLDMPSNWTAFHPAFGEKTSRAIIERSKPKAESFIDRIVSGKTRWLGADVIADLILGILLSPISYLYLLKGRFFLAKIFFANNKCNSCGICVDFCPTGAVRLTGKEQKPYWRYNCESCMRCMSFCPKEAIEAGHSWAALLIFVLGLPFAGAAMRLLNLSDGFTGLHGALEFLLFYPALFLAYFIFSILIKIKPINSLFAYTTLTRWYRRYREPDTRLQDLKPKTETTEEDSAGGSAPIRKD
jgi:Pyruvate/2-oxoacid:ferredoxin oxidoreductase delta subunit